MTEFVKNVVVLNPVGGGSGGGTVNQGEPNPLCSQGWPVRLTGLGNDVIECVDIADPTTQSARVNIVAGLPQQTAIVDWSGTIAVGGTSQLAVASNLNRKYLFIQNVSSGDLWINFDLNATIGQPSIKLTPGEKFVMESSVVAISDVYIIGATLGQEYTAKSSP